MWDRSIARSGLRLVRHFRPGGGEGGALFGNGHKVWGFFLFLGEGGWFTRAWLLLGATGHEAKGFQRSDINAAVFLNEPGYWNEPHGGVTTWHGSGLASEADGKPLLYSFVEVEIVHSFLVKKGEKERRGNSEGRKIKYEKTITKKS